VAGEIGTALTPCIFDIRNVTYRYDEKNVALDGLSMQVQPGRRVVLLGANGSGKSTLLHLLDGLNFAESGAIEFAGQPLTEARLRDEGFRQSFRRRVAMVFQNPDVQLFNPTVFDEVAFGPLQILESRQEIRQRVSEAMESMEIAHLKDRVPHRLSGGEKKRVALASVLVLDPDVLLLDEPTGGLDPKSQSKVIDLLASVAAKKTVVTATHDLNIIEDIADECYVLDAGRIVAVGGPREILHDQALLERTNLQHAHRHEHGGVVHSHPHPHTHAEHDHTHSKI
jgi:cobalt/nickel transport system ATP-binding protein